MADGSGGRLDVVIEAKIDKLIDRLNSADRSIGGFARKSQGHIDRMNAGWGGLFAKTDPLKALDKVFDSSRIKILDTGAARIGLLGSALEHLGPAGIAAAIAITTLGAAFAEAHSAARFAEDIEDAAHKAHVSTSALQELRFALREMGGEEKGADEALQTFSETLGKAQEGLVKSKRGFQALGFTDAQIKGFQTADEALVAVVGAISQLGSPAQKDAVVAQLGLESLKPLVEGGIDKMNELRATARSTGLVMDENLVRRGAEVNKEFDRLTKSIDIGLKSAFIGSAHALNTLLAPMAVLVRAAGDIAQSFASIQDKTDAALNERIGQLSARLFDMQNADAAGKFVNPLDFAETRTELSRAVAEQKARAERAAKASAIPKGTSLKDIGPAGPRDDFAERQDQVRVTVAEAARSLLQAQKGLNDSIEERTRIERDIADQELAEALARIKHEKDAIDLDKVIPAAKKAQLKAELDQAVTSQQQTAEAKKALIAREADWAAEDAMDETRKQVRDAELEVLQHAADIATTAAERRSIELQILKIKQDELTHEKGKELSRQAQTDAIPQPEVDKRFNAFLSTLPAQRDQALRNTRGPLEAFIKETDEAGDKLQDMAVGGLRALNDGLTDAILNAKNLGDVARDVFRQIASDLISQVVHQSISNPIAAFLSHLPGFAGGTSFAPGGMAWVGENGPELLNLPRGSQVITQAQISALTGMRVAGPGGPTVVQQMTFNMPNSILSTDVFAYIDRKTAQARQQGAALGAKLASKGAPARAQAFDLLGT